MAGAAPAPAGHSGSSSTALTRKLGPLPVWAWALVGVAVGYYIYKKRQSSAAAASQATLSSTPATTASGAAPASVMTTSTPETQAAWQQSAAQGAITAGYNPSAVENALANWQNGQPLDSTQEGILNWILSKYGGPPNGVQPVYTGQTTPPVTAGGTGSQGGGYYPTPNPIPATPPATLAQAPQSPYTHIGTEQAGSVLAASGATIYGEPQPGIYVPVVQNGQWTAAGKAYGQEPNNPGLFTQTG